MSNHIVSPNKFKSKKAFKEAVNAGEDPYLEDPSLFSPVSGRLSEVLNAKGVVYVTNHPKRSWFAQVKVVNGNVRVS